MFDILLLRLSAFITKAKCFVGLHDFGCTEEHEWNKKGCTYRHKCHHCHRDEIVKEMYTSQDGAQRDILKVVYVGDQYWKKLLRKWLRSLGSGK